jgi:hypothetical protein
VIVPPLKVPPTAGTETLSSTQMTDEEKRESASEATTSGDQSPAASASHSGTGDINIDQSVHPPTPTEALTYQGERLIGKSPEELLGYFDTHTGIQAQRLVAPFMGKPIRTGGTTNNIVALPDATILVLLEMPNGKVIQAKFEQSWNDRLSEPNKGDPLDLLGRIESFGVGGFSLVECELVDTKP